MTIPVTILMSVYNGEQWLKSVIESVLAQSFTNFEFLIVNDGSTDTTLNILVEYSKLDQRIRVLDKPNSGLADSLNLGIKVAKGEWIARIDADDICKSNRIAIQFAAVCLSNELVLLGCGHDEINSSEMIVGTYSYPTSDSDLKKRLYSGRAFFSHSSAFYRADVVRRIGGYRSRIRRAEDYDLWLRMSETGTIQSVATSLVSIRKHENQISNDEGGARQFYDSKVALVSYYLRKTLAKDPVDNSASDIEFESFREFVIKSYEKLNYIKYLKFVSLAKQLLRGRSAFKYTKTLWVFFLNPNFLCRYFLHYFIGDFHCKRIAIRWIRSKRVV